MNEEEQIKTELADLIAEAKKANMWLYCNCHDIWLSPLELKEKNNKGKFLWGRVNWQMRSPTEELENINDKVDKLINEFSQLSKRIQLSLSD